jgi:hypothetical protein
LGIWPGGFLLSALPTQPAHGLPTALPLPVPLPAEPPVLVALYGPDEFAPPVCDADTFAPVADADADVEAGAVSASAHAGPARSATAATNPTYRSGLGRIRGRETMSVVPLLLRVPPEAACSAIDGAVPTSWA